MTFALWIFCYYFAFGRTFYVHWVPLFAFFCPHFPNMIADILRKLELSETDESRVQFSNVIPNKVSHSCTANWACLNPTPRSEIRKFCKCFPPQRSCSGGRGCLITGPDPLATNSKKSAANFSKSIRFIKKFQYNGICDFSPPLPPLPGSVEK